ncbi:LysR family transcriptional regulator, partial [Serratia marcescens]
VAIGAMPRHAAVVVDMAERATPLAQKFFDAASEWLRQRNV